MKNSLIMLVAALGLGLGGCTTTTYNGMQYHDGSYYAPADGSNGDYYVAPEPDPYFYDPYYGPYGYPGYWWRPLSYGGWGDDGCGLYRFCPLWATRWYDPWSDLSYVDGYGYGGGYGYGYGSGFGFSLGFGDGGWYGGGSGWYGGSWAGGGWHGGGRHGHDGHDDHDGRGGHDGHGGNWPPRHRDGPGGPTPPSAPDSVAVTDPPIGADDEADQQPGDEDAIGGAHGRPLPGRRWFRVADPVAPMPQGGVPSRWFDRSAPSDGQRAGGWSNAGSPRGDGGRSSGRNSNSVRSSDDGARSQRRSEPAPRADGDDSGGHSGRRVRGDADDT